MRELDDNLDENYAQFLEDALDQGCVWGLQQAEGWALCPSEKYPDCEVMVFWSQQAFAQHHCVGDWQKYQAVAIDINEFLEEWLPGMHSDVYLVGVNWNNELQGDEIEPLDLLQDFEQLLD